MSMRPKTAPNLERKGTRNLGSLMVFLNPSTTSNVAHLEGSGMISQPFQSTAGSITSNPPSPQENRSKFSKVKKSKSSAPPMGFAAVAIDQSSDEFMKYWRGTGSLQPYFERRITTLGDFEDVKQGDAQNAADKGKHERVKSQRKLRRRSSMDHNNDNDNPDDGINDTTGATIEPDLSDPYQAQHRRFNTSYSKVSERLRKTVIGSTTTLQIELGTETALVPDKALQPRDVLLQQAILHHENPFSIRTFNKSVDEHKHHKSKRNSVGNLGFHSGTRPVTEIDVHGLGLGDQKGICLAETLHSCPRVQTIDVSGNRLTDRSLQPLLENMLRYLHVTSLDVSDNKMDQASITILKENLKDSSCVLRVLKLRKSDIDDEECADLMDAVMLNHSVVTLDLAENFIGEMEDYNTVNPDFITGGEAIAEMLSSSTTIEELDLSWNKIRKDSALTLSRSLAGTSNLVVLKLAHNNIGDYAAQHLGHALRTNRSLMSIDVSYNGLHPKSALVFANALHVNKHITELNLSGSSLGEPGAKALLKTILSGTSSEHILKVLFEDTNLRYKDNSIFSREKPSGHYNLDLTDPYEFVVAEMLVEIANSRITAKFQDVMYLKDTGEWEQVELARAIDKRISSQKDVSDDASWISDLSEIDSGLDAISFMRGNYESELKRQFMMHHVHMAAKRSTASIASFCQKLGFDPTASTVVRIEEILMQASKEERKSLRFVISAVLQAAFRSKPPTSHCDLACERDVKSIFHALGYKAHCSKDMSHEAKLLISTIDFSMRGGVTEAEFISYMLLDLMVVHPPSPTPLFDKRTNSMFTIPESGRLKFKFELSPSKVPEQDLIDEADARLFLQSMHICTQHDAALFQELLKTILSDETFKVTSDVADILLPTLHRHHQGLDDVVKFIPRLATSKDARRFVTNSLNFEDVVRLRERIGSALSVMVGNACGHYHLDLSSPVDFSLAQRIFELDALEQTLYDGRTKKCTGQHGDWTNLRNGSLNGKKIRLNGSWFESMDKHAAAGRIRFDYVSTARPVPGVEPMTEFRFQDFLRLVFERDPIELVPVVIEDTEDNIPKQKNNPKKQKIINNTKIRKKSVSKLASSLPTLPKASADDASATTSQESVERLLLSVHGNADTEKLDVKKRERAMAFARARAGFLDEAFQSILPEVPVVPMLLSSSEEYAQSSKYRHKQIVDRFLWNDYYDTSRIAYKIVFAKELYEKIEKYFKAQSALREDTAASAIKKNTKMKTNNVAEKKKNDIDNSTIARDNAAAWHSALYTAHRAHPFHEAEVMPFTVRSKIYTGVLTKIVPMKDNDNTIDQSAVVERCLRFERNLNVIDAILVYNVWLSCDQLRTLLLEFRRRSAPDAVLERIICAVFCRIVDLDNLFQLLQSISHCIAHNVIHRLGILNVLNPLQPNGSYEMDLAAWDHREAAKVIVKLCLVEPGENMLNEQLALSLLEVPLHGWTLPVRWAESPDFPAMGPEREGILTFAFTSSKPSIPIRKSLQQSSTLCGRYGSFVACKEESVFSRPFTARSATHEISDDLL